MKHILLILSLLLSLFSSCQKQKKYKEYDCTADKKIETLPDSSFFSDIRCMQCHNNKLYFLDVQRRDVVILNEDFDDIQIIGSPGPGPEELTIPDKLYVLEDTVYIMDFGSESIKSFYEKNYLSACYSSFSENRFFCTSDKLYLPILTDSSSFVVKNKESKENSTEQYGGRITKFETGRETFIRNAKNLLYDNDDFFYAVSNNLTIIEKYDLKTLKLISTFDLSEVSIIKKNLNYIASKAKNENSYYTLIEDSYIANNSIYLLCTNLISPIKANQLVKITISPQMEVTSIYTLPGNIYRSFCVSEDYIFAFNWSGGTIDRIKLADYE